MSNKPASEREARLSHEIVLLRTLSVNLQKTLDVDRILHILLTGLTAGGALGFSRAAIFFLHQENKELRDGRGIGPFDKEDASRIWNEVAHSNLTLEQLFTNSHRTYLEEQKFPREIRKVKISIDSLSPIGAVQTVLAEQKVCVLKGEEKKRLPGVLYNLFEAGSEVVIAPLVVRERTAGIVLADNAFHNRPVNEATLEFFSLVLGLGGLALGNAMEYRETKQNLEKLEQLNETLRNVQAELVACERLAAIGKISTYLAHEIRNPLVAIGGFVRQILGMDDAQQIQRNVRIINSEIVRLERVLNNLLRFSSPMQPVKERVLLAEIFETLEPVLKTQAEQRNVTLTFDVPGDIVVFVDRVQMNEVIYNLVMNALENTQTSGKVAISARGGSDFVRIEVEDTGCGISPENLKKVFDPFFTTKLHGTGLGLAVVKAIVEEHHGGKVGVSSELGKGTKVHILIPKGGEHEETIADRG
jgi:hypothetical protein